MNVCFPLAVEECKRRWKRTHTHQVPSVPNVNGIAIAANSQALAVTTSVVPPPLACCWLTNCVEKKFWKVVNIRNSIEG